MHYAETALDYFDAGWFPIPTGRGRDGGYILPKGYLLFESREQVNRWIKQYPDRDVGIRPPSNVIGVDVDDYVKDGHTKVGGSTVQQTGVKLPATWTSTSRGADSVSRIYWYQVPADRKWKDLGGDVETIQRRHRFGSVWPSTHKEGRSVLWYRPDGTVADRLPRTDELTELLDEWIALLDSGQPEGNGSVNGSAVSVAAAKKWLATLPQGEACQHVLRAYDEDMLTDPGSRHQKMVSATWELIQLGAEGHRGVAAAIVTLQDDYVAAVDRSTAEGEFKRSLLGAVGSDPPEPMKARKCRTQVNPSDLLDRVYAFLGRFVAYPSEHAHVAHTLWIAHTHLMSAWDSTPRIAFLSPEPGSGKTRALEVSELLTPNPVEAVNVTPAYLFRKVGKDSPTILYDEIDTVFGPKAKDNEEIRGLLNAGHRRGAVAGRAVVKGKVVETEEIPAFCAVAMAGLGGLPDTLLSRSVVVRMRRRAPGERVEPFRRRLHLEEGHSLRDQLAAWAPTVVDKLSSSWPVMPDGIEDRDADVWEALLAVADEAGWSDRGRKAAVALVEESRDSTPSLGVRLLADIRDVFGDRRVMSTDELLAALVLLDESPWGDLGYGRWLDARGLAMRLRAYGITSGNVKIKGRVLKGYAAVFFHDAWTRYLPVAEVAAR